jgi:nucleoside phosphorylase
MNGGEEFTLRQSKRVRHDTFDENSTASHKRARDDGDGRGINYECDTRRLKLPREHYTIGWIAALPIEMAAAKGMLDNIHQSLDRVENDTNTYVLGNIGKHNIVIACLPNNGYGTTNAATVAGNMRRSFDSIQVFLVVGVAGGVPEKADLRLGDVVIGNEVVQYDFGKTGPGGVFRSTGSLNKPPQSLMTAVSALRAQHESKPNEIAGNLLDMLRKYPHMSKYMRPEEAPDRLFKSTYDGNSHIQGTDSCESCEDSELVLRPKRIDTSPRIFYGRIASGNQVMKHGATRERLAQEHNVLCFEMEAAGLMDGFSCLPVRGVCDYSDSHKNKRYQEYAAATAAAYAKELLSVLGPFAVNTTPDKEPSPSTGRSKKNSHSIHC